MSVTLGPYIAYYNSVITDYIKSAMQQRVWILHELLQKGGHICHVGNLLCYWRCCSHNWQFVDLLLDMHVMVTALTCCCVMKVDDTGARWSSFILSNFSSVLVMTVGLLLLLVFLCSSCFLVLLLFPGVTAVDVNQNGVSYLLIVTCAVYPVFVY